MEEHIQGHKVVLQRKTKKQGGDTNAKNKGFNRSQRLKSKKKKEGKVKCALL